MTFLETNNTGPSEETDSVLGKGMGMGKTRNEKRDMRNMKN